MAVMVLTVASHRAGASDSAAGHYHNKDGFKFTGKLESATPRACGPRVGGRPGQGPSLTQPGRLSRPGTWVAAPAQANPKQKFDDDPPSRKQMLTLTLNIRNAKEQ